MKSLVIYDSTFGNTEIIAQSIAAALGEDARAMKAAAVTPADLENLELLVVGAPTNGGRATPPMQTFLKGLDRLAVKGVAYAAFDTRTVQKWVSIFGYAAKRIHKQLAALGGKPVAEPEGFFVTGTKGPLKDGETERAAAWARGLAAARPA
jgi:flavodoxin I